VAGLGLIFNAPECFVEGRGGRVTAGLMVEAAFVVGVGLAAGFGVGALVTEGFVTGAGVEMGDKTSP
jgi:hypothetical protein